MAQLCAGVHQNSGYDYFLSGKAAIKPHEAFGSIQMLGCVAMLWSSWTLAASINTALDDEDLDDRKVVLRQLLRELDAGN